MILLPDYKNAEVTLLCYFVSELFDKAGGSGSCDLKKA